MNENPQHKQRRCGQCRNVGHDRRTCNMATPAQDELLDELLDDDEWETGLDELLEPEQEQMQDAQNRAEQLDAQNRAEQQDSLNLVCERIYDRQVQEAHEEGISQMVALPVLRETAVEMKECPICIDNLGETGKTVLKCGHTVCVSCFLEQILDAHAAKNVEKCMCPVCRVNYIK